MLCSASLGNGARFGEERDEWKGTKGQNNSAGVMDLLRGCIFHKRGRSGTFFSEPLAFPLTPALFSTGARHERVLFGLINRLLQMWSAFVLHE